LVPGLHSTRTAVSASRLEPTDDRSTRCSCQKRDLGDPSLALSDGATVSGRDRLASPRGRLQPSNPYTLRPCATPASGANSTHPSPSARHFRVPFNKLASSEPRRMFCSCRAAVRGFAQPCVLRWPPACPAWGGGRLVAVPLSTRAAVSASRESRLMTEAHAAAVRSAITGIRRRHCRTVQRFKDAIA
jgi:hypothetical protein